MNREPVVPEKYGKVIFAYVPTEAERQKNNPPTYWSVPEEIMVVEINDAVNGLAVFEMWRGKWEWANYSNRFLVGKLIELLEVKR